MAPFLGVVAAEPAGDEPVSAILAGPYGGNLVLRDLTAGSHLFLPVQKPGGRIWIGDVHALQGDGVVDQTAIETAAEELDIRYDLHKRRAAARPARRDGDVLDRHRVRRDSRRRLRRVAAGADPLAVGRGGHHRAEAYALASMAVSFRVTQYANQTGSAYSSIPPKAVHAVIPKSVFPAGIQARVAAWLRPAEAASDAVGRRPVRGRPGRHPGGPGREPSRRGRLRCLFTDDAVLDGAQGGTPDGTRCAPRSGRSGPRKVPRACTSPSTPWSRRGKPPTGRQ